MGFMFAGSVSAQINGTPCEALPNGGLGEETCKKPNATRGEGVLWTAAEQAVSIVSAIADSRGCFQAQTLGPVSLSVEVELAGPVLHWYGNSTLGGLQFTTTEQVHDASQQDGARKYLTQDMVPGNVLGQQVSELSGAFYSDGAYSIMHGDSDFRHGASELDEHIIKDFYEGIPVPPTFGDGPNGACPVPATEADFLAGRCVVVNAGDHNASDPFERVRVIRDNGLEVTTKKYIFPNLLGSNTFVEVGAPKGKWRQVSFYREPDGPGNGALTFNKVRIAPFGNPECLIRLSGTVRGTVDDPRFSGTISAVAF
jgi:hypothetical protein